MASFSPRPAGAVPSAESRKRKLPLAGAGHRDGRHLYGGFGFDHSQRGSSQADGHLRGIGGPGGMDSDRLPSDLRRHPPLLRLAGRLLGIQTRFHPGTVPFHLRLVPLQPFLEHQHIDRFSGDPGMRSRFFAAGGNGDSNPRISPREKGNRLGILVGGSLRLRGFGPRHRGLPDRSFFLAHHLRHKRPHRNHGNGCHAGRPEKFQIFSDALLRSDRVFVLERLPHLSSSGFS